MRQTALHVGLVAGLTALAFSSHTVAQGDAPAPLGGELPVLSRLGATPPPASTFAIEIHEGGFLSHRGVPMDYARLTERLSAAAKAMPGKRVGAVNTSALDVLIRADADLPTQAVTMVLWACAEQRVAAPRIWFGAQHSGGGEGALAMFLPIDAPASAPAVEGQSLPVRVRGGEPVSAAALTQSMARYMAAIDEPARKHVVSLVKVPGNLAWGRTLELIEAVHRAEVPYAVLMCDPSAAQRRAFAARDVRGIVAAGGVERTMPGLALGPITVRASGAIARTPETLSTEAVGFMSSSVPLLALEEEIVEEEEFVEEPEEIVEEPILVDDFGDPAIAQPPAPGVGGKYGPRLDPTERARAGRATAKAIERGLAWLTQQQADDGGWNPEEQGGNRSQKVGATGLALLALLADGNSMDQGPFKANVTRAVQFLVRQQQDNGLIGTNQTHDFIYGHAIATLALLEACGLTRSPAGDGPVRAAAQRGLDYLESHRNPYSVWRYQPRDNDNDTSVTTWCVLALCAGRDFGFEVNSQALKIAETWFDQVADPATGRHGYSKRGELSSRQPGDHGTRFPPENNEAMTGAALFARYMLGQDPKRHEVMERAADLIASKPPLWKVRAGNVDYYAWYWSTLAMYQTGGREWKAWAQAVRRALSEGQSSEGEHSGSWPAVGVWCQDGGRIYSTALALMTLQTYYRYSRLIR